MTNHPYPVLEERLRKLALGFSGQQIPIDEARRRLQELVLLADELAPSDPAASSTCRFCISTEHTSEQHVVRLAAASD